MDEGETDALQYFTLCIASCCMIIVGYQVNLVLAQSIFEWGL